MCLFVCVYNYINNSVCQAVFGICRNVNMKNQNCNNLALCTNMSFIFLSLSSYPSRHNTHKHTHAHMYTNTPPSLLFAPQANVCDSGVQYEGSEVSAGGAGCTSLWYHVLPESLGGRGGQHLPRAGTLIYSHACTLIHSQTHTLTHSHNYKLSNPANIFYGSYSH